MTTQLEPWLTTTQVSELLGFSEETILRWAGSGEILSFRVGGQRRFLASDLRIWMEQRRAGPDRLAPVHELRETQ